MRNVITIVLTFFSLVLLAVFIKSYFEKDESISGAPPYGEAESEAPAFGSFEWMQNWKRPEGPPKVALQVGHWKSEEVPEEQKRLRENTGSSGGGKWEWEINLAIARETEKLLKEKGITVEILPATVPPQYWADIFLAIHADGSTDASKRGFKIASPWRDYTGSARELVLMLENSYEDATGYEKDENITRNMRGYYAFSWWRYQHAIHPMTTGAIIETGFLTNREDQKLLINSPEIPAHAIAEGIINYLEVANLL